MQNCVGAPRPKWSKFVWAEGSSEIHLEVGRALDAESNIVAATPPAEVHNNINHRFNSVPVSWPNKFRKVGIPHSMGGRGRRRNDRCTSLMSSESVSLFSSKAISTSSSYLGVISLLVGTIQLFAHQKRKKMGLSEHRAPDSVAFLWTKGHCWG